MSSRSPHNQHDATLAPEGLLVDAVVDPELLRGEHELAHRRRRHHRTAAGAVAFAVFLGIAALAASVGLSGTPPTTGVAPAPVAVKSEAVAVVVIRPGQEAERIAAATPVAGGSAIERGAAAAWSLPGIGSVERATTDARISMRDRQADATTRIERIELLDGRIVLTGATITATSDSTDGRASGSLTLGPATTLLVDGTERAATLNQRIAIENVGTVIINEQAVLANVPTGDAQTGPRHRIVGALAHVRLSQPVGNLPSGSEIVIGRVDAGVREGKVREVAHPTPGVISQPALPTGGAPSGLQPGSPAPGETSLPRLPIAVRANAAPDAGNLQAYLFPVLGESNYTDTWGAPRASTGVPHQGTDIFAAEGTPLVAVADGVLDRVGWNSIGGYRFWLFDQYGNSFYYAHLSAFSPLAQDGARVRRGDVIGFVGHTGDAQYTPPHLHFEIHPGNGAATNPFPFLGAWRTGVAVAIGLVTGDGTDRIAPLALLGFTDISANSGLQASVLDSVPDTRARSIEQETEPRPTDESLSGAINGAGISRE